MNTSKMNARMTSAYERYTASDNYSLYDVYKTFSPAKARAWECCKDLCDRNGGYALKVISANTFAFTAGFCVDTFQNPDGSEGDTSHKVFFYITPSSDTEAYVF